MFRRLLILLALGTSAYFFTQKPVQHKNELNVDDNLSSMYLDCSN